MKGLIIVHAGISYTNPRNVGRLSADRNKKIFDACAVDIFHLPKNLKSMLLLYN